MQTPFSINKDYLDILLQVLLVVVPIVLSWLVRTYVKNSSMEKGLAAITRLSNAAIDFAENMDKRGDLVLPPDIKKSTAKLKLASEWLENELDRNGIHMSNEDAEKWISSEVQRRIGSVRPVEKTAEYARMAIDLVQGLENKHQAGLGADPARFEALCSLAADWVVAQLAQNTGTIITHNEAVTWVRAEFFQRLHMEHLPAASQGMDLGRQAVAFMNGLKASGKLSADPNTPGSAGMEKDIAVAWMLTEAAKQGLPISTEEIVHAVGAALQENSRALPAHAAPAV